jgi:hypothetical protein
MPAAARYDAASRRGLQALRRATHEDLHRGFTLIRPMYARLRDRLLEEYRHGGIEQLSRTYRHWHNQLVIAPRGVLFRDAMQRAAERRAALLAAELERRYGGRRPFHPETIPRAIQHVWSRPRGRRRWAYAQRRLPTDVMVRQRFTALLDDWRRRHRTDRGLAIQAKRDDGPAPWPDRTPRIDPKLRKIAYPIELSPDEIDLVEQALDTVVVGRGQYFAEVGLTDIIREADRAVSMIESGRQAVIVGWRWTLSSAHTEEVCPSGICSALAEADVGHPHGAGVYFDALIPSSHPNCWCETEAEWATDDEAADPNFEAPEPPDDYESRVRAIFAACGVELLAAADAA